MKYFLVCFVLYFVSGSAWSGAVSTTEEPKLACYDELQGGDYPTERVQEKPEWRLINNIAFRCTRQYEGLVSILIYRVGLGEVKDLYDVASNYRNWTTICQSAQEAIDCINSYMSHCSNSFGSWYFREGEYYLTDSGINRFTSMRAFPSRACTGANVKHSLQTILNKKPDRDCIELNAIRTKCLDSWLHEIQNYNAFVIYDPLERQHWKELSASMLRCALDLLAVSNCSKIQQELHYQATKVLLPWTVNVDELDPNSTKSIDYGQIQRCTAGVYGDPHIRLCDAEYLITCSSPGSQIYYSGPLLEMIGVNTRVGTTEATTLTNIDIKFYSEKKTLVCRYQADDSKLPSTLVGQSSSGPSLGGVEVVTVSAGNEVNLIYRPLGLIIKLRRWDENYFFTMRAAKALFSAGSGLLVTGCPTSERLDIFRENRARRGVTDASCENACDEVLQTEFYEACFFDCKTMRSLEATQMTKQAIEMEDEVRLNDTELRKTAITINYDDIDLSTSTSFYTSVSSSIPRTTNSASMFRFSLLGVIFTLVALIGSAV